MSLGGVLYRATSLGSELGSRPRLWGDEVGARASEGWDGDTAVGAVIEGEGTAAGDGGDSDSRPAPGAAAAGLAVKVDTAGADVGGVEEAAAAAGVS